MPHKTLAVALSALVVGAMLAAGAQSRWDGLPWLGNVGILPLAVAVATLIFLGLNSRYTARSLENTRTTLEHARRAELATRFHKALELLESEHATSRIGGLTVLRDVATGSPIDYWGPIAQVLAHYIQSRTEKNYAIWDGKLDGVYEDTGPDVKLAIELLGLGPETLKRAIQEYEMQGTIKLQYAALVNLQLQGLDFRHVEFYRVYFRHGLVMDCDFSGAELYLEEQGLMIAHSRLVGSQVTVRSEREQFRRAFTFTDCDLSQAGIEEWGSEALVECVMDQCQLTDALLRFPILTVTNCWHSGVEPIVTEFEDGSLVGEVLNATGASVLGKSRLGMPVYFVS